MPGVGEKTAISLLQQFGTLDGIYEHLDEVKGKLRERLAEHRESAFMSREVGRIVTDLPVELGLEEARTGRYDRRAVAQRFRELEFRSLIDRLPASSIAPTGYDSPEQETKGGLQLSLDLLGGRGGAADRRRRREPGRGPTRSPIRAARSSTSTRGSCRSRRRDGRARRRGSRRTATTIGLGWAVGSGRPLETPPARDRARRAPTAASWYVPCDPSSVAIERLPALVRAHGSRAASATT